MNGQNGQHAERPLHTLIELAVNGEATGEQIAQLERRLIEDQAARDAYLDYVNLHSALSRRFLAADSRGVDSPAEGGGRHLAAAESRRPRVRRHLTARMAALPVGVVLLSTAALLVWLQFREQPSPYRTATVREVVGDVMIINSSGASAAQVGEALRPGDRLRTGSGEAEAVLEYADGTTVHVHVDSVVQVPVGHAVCLRLLAGSVEIDAAPQPAGRPLIFATAHARYVVVGTSFRLYRGPGATRLELSEGQVRLERRSGRRLVEALEVEPGCVAIASEESAPVEIHRLAAGSYRLKATLPKAGQAVAFSPQGDLLATADWERGLKRWRTGDLALWDESADDAGRTDGLAFLPDGRSVVQVNQNGYVLVWPPDADTARKLPLIGRSARSRGVSADGRFVVQSADEGTEVSAIEASAGRLSPRMHFRGPGKAWCLSLSPPGGRLAAGFWDGTLRVYDVPSADVIFQHRLRHTPTHVALSAGAERLAVFTQSDGLVVIDLANGRQRPLLAPGTVGVFCLKFTPDGRWLMAGCGDRTARVWSAADGCPLLVIDAEHSPRDVAWCPEHRLLATAADTVKLWECTAP